VLLISKMWSSLSTRGVIRRWWKLAMTDVTPAQSPPAITGHW
jgi:hypothetical protein